MKLHLQNMAAAAGADDDEIEQVSKIVRSSGERITMAAVVAALESVRS